MSHPAKMGYQPLVGFLLGFLSLLVALSYFSTQLANKSLLQAKALSSLAQKLNLSSLNANSPVFSSAKNSLSRSGHRHAYQPLNLLSHIKHKTARIRNMILKIVHANQNRTVNTIEFVLDKAQQKIHATSAVVIDIILNRHLFTTNKRTINAL
ncbi:hypothetical protein [Thiomicrorhabdus heinhorstiae]|uniref:Uncharacterized protein n=1 Tax=Thiomicrorhabdus heinhorstiae TaxID=2748010 RepID=A0ABS0BTD7_9GAMM|nr:hypothetical protein [Thiomicrorhabdus heinhorstiae]MBF6057101.1 hypothetical protein [Thiomicrorhabdus heinhorstiae]